MAKIRFRGPTERQEGTCKLSRKQIKEMGRMRRGGKRRVWPNTDDCYRRKEKKMFRDGLQQGLCLRLCVNGAQSEVVPLPWLWMKRPRDDSTSRNTQVNRRIDLTKAYIIDFILKIRVFLQFHPTHHFNSKIQ